MILGYPTILIPGLQAKRDNSTSQPEFVLTDEEVSWIGSMSFLFVPFGSLISALLMDRIGRKLVLQVGIH